MTVFAIVLLSLALLLLAVTPVVVLVVRQMQVRGRWTFPWPAALAVCLFASVALLLMAGVIGSRQDSPQHYERGVRLLAQGRPTEAAWELSLVTPLDGARFAQAQKKLEEARKAVAAEHYRRGLKLQQQSDYEGAAREFRAVRSGSDEYAAAQEQLARVQRLQKRAGAKSAPEASATTEASEVAPPVAAAPPNARTPKRDFLGFVDTHARFRYGTGQVVVDNLDKFPYEGILVTLNPDSPSKGHSARIERLAAGDSAAVPLETFADRDGNRFDFTEKRVLNIQMTCKTPYGNGIQRFGEIKE